MRFPVGLVLAIIFALLRVNAANAAPSSPGGRLGVEGVHVVPWPRLSESDQGKAVAALKQYAHGAAVKLDLPLQMYETNYFLFYSDLPDKETQKWAGVLDRMYDRLRDIFGVQAGDNIWCGKALVFVFSKADDYRRYETEIRHTNPGSTAGLCHPFPNGFVTIAFYRQPDELEFAHVLVHESVHGFIHRYRTPVTVPNWANEGLAETIASDLVPQKGRREMVTYTARSGLKQHHNNVGDFFSLPNIQGWQYPVAEMLCTYMIQKNRQNYVSFICRVKEGGDCETSLTTEFGSSPDDLLQEFGRWLSIRDLKR